MIKAIEQMCSFTRIRYPDPYCEKIWIRIRKTLSVLTDEPVDFGGRVERLVDLEHWQREGREGIGDKIWRGVAANNAANH